MRPFAECVRCLPEVFDVNQRPWIQPSGAPAELVAEVVRRCPTGALHYELHDGPTEAPDRATHIHAVADGPITLRGELRIDTPTGEMADVRAALCRCGLTANQPFRDQPAECARHDDHHRHCAIWAKACRACEQACAALLEAEAFAELQKLAGG